MDSTTKARKGFSQRLAKELSYCASYCAYCAYCGEWAVGGRRSAVGSQQLAVGSLTIEQ